MCIRLCRIEKKSCTKLLKPVCCYGLSYPKSLQCDVLGGDGYMYINKCYKENVQSLQDAFWSIEEGHRGRSEWGVRREDVNAWF